MARAATRVNALKSLEKRHNAGILQFPGTSGSLSRCLHATVTVDSIRHHPLTEDTVAVGDLRRRELSVLATFCVA